ncbi:hypothetical protein OC834_007061 [Tilletia horrida]|nr:hypothetical protein OC834_007061 [Tilletia horrida]
MAAMAATADGMEVDSDGVESKQVCFLDTLPSEVLFQILRIAGSRSTFEFGLTATRFWSIATEATLWRQISLQLSDPPPTHLAPSLRQSLTRPSERVNIEESKNDKGKQKATDVSQAAQEDDQDEWTSWAALTLARNNAARQLAFYRIAEPAQILLGSYGETLAVLVGMLQTRQSGRSKLSSPTITNLASELFPLSSVLGRHRFRSWIFPRDLSKQPLLEGIQDGETAGKSRKRRRLTRTASQSASQETGATSDPIRDIAERARAFSTRQLAAELHCLVGPLYLNQRDVMETSFWLQLCDPRNPHAPPLKPKSPLLRLLNEQPRGTARPCSHQERTAAQERVYDSGNFAHANQWGPLRPWIATRAALDPASATPAPTIEVPGINATPATVAIVEVNTLQGAAVAASVLDHLDANEDGASPDAPVSISSPPAPSSDVAPGDVGLGAAAAANAVDAQDEEEEEEDPDFEPPVDWEAETEDGNSEASFNAQLELAMSEASSRRSVTAHRILRERRAAGLPLVKEIDWELVEAIMLCMHSNIEEAKETRGWGLSIPTALFQAPGSATSLTNGLPGSSSSSSAAATGPNAAIQTLAQQQLQQGEAAANMDVDGPMTRRRRRSLMESSDSAWYDPLKVPTGWDKSHGPDPRKEPNANPRDWAGVEGVWIGTYAFQDFPTALTRGVDFTHLEPDVVGDCLQLCLRVLPEGELLPPADEEICAQPTPDGSDGGGDSAGQGYELLPDLADVDEVLPPLRLQGHAVQYRPTGEEVRRSSIYGMVRPVYGEVASTRDAGKSALGQEVGLRKEDGPDTSKAEAETNAKAKAGKPAKHKRLVIKGFHWNLCHRYLNSNSWSLSGIQPGGLGSRLPILGIWTDADRNAAQPCGPWLYYRIGNRRWEDVREELAQRA